MTDICARCARRVTCVANYRTTTSRIVERLCTEHGNELAADDRITVHWLDPQLLEGAA